MKTTLLAFISVLSLLPPSAAANSTSGPRLIAHANGIEGEYIVALAGDVADQNVDSVVAELTREFGGTLGRQYRHAFRGFSVLQLSAEYALAMSRHPAVALVEQNAPLYPSGVQTNPQNWALDRIDQRSGLNASYTYTSTGNNVNAYIVDSGIRYDHVEFGGRAVFAADFVDSWGGGWDCYGHGTAVAGLVGGVNHGVAKQARLHSVRIIGCQTNSSTDVNRLIAALDWLIYHHVKPAVANVSFNYYEPAPPNTPICSLQPHQLLNTAAKALIDAGVPLVNSAGNAECVVNSAPATADWKVVVAGASLRNDRRVSNTAYCGTVDVYAPGWGLKTASHLTSTATTDFSLTSAAAAVVTGVVARYLETHPTATPAQVNAYVNSSATPGVVQNIPVPWCSKAVLYADPQM